MPGRRTKNPPALGSVRELFASTRKQELDTDQAEVVAALDTPRPGRAYDDDQRWSV